MFIPRIFHGNGGNTLWMGSGWNSCLLHSIAKRMVFVIPRFTTLGWQNGKFIFFCWGGGRNNFYSIHFLKILYLILFFFLIDRKVNVIHPTEIQHDFHLAEKPSDEEMWVRVSSEAILKTKRYIDINHYYKNNE